MGKVIMSGIVPQLAAPVPPAKNILASSLAVGSTVKLMENGTAVEYLVVNKGIPSNSSLYHSSCNGLWLLRKNLYTNMKWDASNSSYVDSDAHAYLNGTFLGLFGSDIRSAIQQVTIPYVNGTGSKGSVSSGSNGLSTKIFLLSGYEVGWTITTNTNFHVDGACLSYFAGTSSTDNKRIGYYGGTACNWWIRSPYKADQSNVWCVSVSGYCNRNSCDTQNYIRPALVLPLTAMFDEETLLFTGVA